MILLLLQLDLLLATLFGLSTPSDEFLGLSEVGDLMDSHRGCLVKEALIERGMHFDCPGFESSLSSTESNCLLVL